MLYIKYIVNRTVLQYLAFLKNFQGAIRNYNTVIIISPERISEFVTILTAVEVFDWRDIYH